LSNDRQSNPSGGPERFLRVDHLAGDLRSRSVRGGVVTLSNQAGKFFLTLGSTALLARLLTPEDFGLIAMVLSVIGFIGNFKDMGLATATVQRAEISHGEVSTLFWINLTISIALMSATAALAPALAWFYNEPRLTEMTLVLAGTIVFSGLTVQHQALLKRQMRFAALAAIEFTSLFIGVTSAVIAALSGLGYWSLVFVPVMKEVCTTIGVWIACGWRPGKPARRTGVRSLISFGAHLTGFNLVNYVARSLDKVLIGRQIGAAPLGLYNKAYQLVLLPMQQINTPLTSVAVPTLSRLQNDPERYRAFYRRGVMLTVSVGMPAVAFLFVDAYKAVLTILGSQWTDSVPIFRALGPAAFIGTFNVATGWVYISLGLTRRQFAWGLFASTVIILGYFIGLRWGVIGIAASLSISLAVLRLPAILYCFRVAHPTLRDLGAALWRPTVASLAAAAGLHFLSLLLPAGPNILIGLFIDFVIYSILYILIWVGLPGGRTAASIMLNLLRDSTKPPSTGQHDNG